MTQTTNVNQRVAAEMRAWMGRRGFRQRDLAERLGVSQVWVSRHAKGEANFTVDDVVALSNALGCSVMDLFPDAREMAGAGATSSMTPAPAWLPHLDSNQKPAD